MRIVSILLIIMMSAMVRAGIPITDDYLMDTWCFESMSAGGETYPEGLIWKFESDGRFMAQRSSMSSEIRHAGHWRIEDGKLEIKPVYMGGLQKVTVESPDRFVIHWTGNLNVQRGACSGL